MGWGMVTTGRVAEPRGAIKDDNGYCTKSRRQKTGTHRTLPRRRANVRLAIVVHLRSSNRCSPTTGEQDKRFQAKDINNIPIVTVV